VTRDTRAIIATAVALGAIHAGVATVAISQKSRAAAALNGGVHAAIGELNAETAIAALHAEMNSRVSELEADVAALRTDVSQMGESLENIEHELEQVDGRLGSLERAILP